MVLTQSKAEVFFGSRLFPTTKEWWAKPAFSTPLKHDNPSDKTEDPAFKLFSDYCFISSVRKPFTTLSFI
jgi:hypothetical protein